MTKKLMTGVAVGALLAFAAPAYADITIAVAGPMTGQYATFGEQMRNGAELAVEELNAAGGINGEKVILKVGDDACDPKQAVTVANQLASDGVTFVAGHFCSGSSIPASSVYEEEGVIQISPASTNPTFTDDRPGPGIYRTCGRDDKQGVVAGQYLAEKYKGKPVAILHDKSAYGKGLADETQKALQAAGEKEALYEAYTAGEKDYSALVSKLKAANVEAVYIGGYHTEAGLILRQMRDQGLNAQIVSGDALVTDEFGQITGDLSDGTMMTFAPDARKFPEAADVVKKFEAKKINPEGYTLYTYAAIQAYAKAVTDAKTTDFEPVVEKLDSETFKTVIGDLKFDEKGDPTEAPYVWYVWKGGKYAQM
ncbi:branched chain amino acid ABC transporter substrate-binding protein [Agaricicola taiwanensis]|uniref:Branched chain amino acid ABC transporter substrate-binding protein n=1 Tax=Agaricicola taiwanensis TaxID=591372 RepID=A0A8J2VW81_9RHOB|nr:branched-chain amino acid ABC transporter substrate-binding protein [Agaricicola taiwanensis]GGE41955.1 branched chain amino acid ABC transporter substrate-binding protein [Agaricicola taiwanensis]